MINLKKRCSVLSGVHKSTLHEHIKVAIGDSSHKPLLNDTHLIITIQNMLSSETEQI